MATIPAAFPFIEVRIDTSALVPVAQRAPGVIAVLGKTTDGADGGAAELNKPMVVATNDDAVTLFAKKNADGTVAATPLSTSLALALQQDPKPSKIYGVRVQNDNYAAALAGLEAADDVTFVALANESTVGAAAAGGAAPTGLMALKDHVERLSSDGSKRIGVAMVDPTRAKSSTYSAQVDAAVSTLKSDSGRMVLVAARGATTDTATAAMAVMASLAPQVSLVLKPIRGIQIPIVSQFSPSETRALSELNINPVIQSSLIPGEILRFGEGRTYTTDAALLYVDLVRVLDDIDFRLKAGLVGQVGDARITKQGMTRLRIRLDEILGPLRQSQEIADYTVDIPVLNILNVPESTWSAADRQTVVDARANRLVDLLVSVTYGPAVHRLKVTLAPKF